jgi:hypothetical protein
VFGYMIVQRLLILTWLFSRLPKWNSRGFAWVLNAATPLFDPVNYYGTNLATLVYNHKRLATKLDGVINALQRSLARQDPKALGPGKHYDHHRRQLTLAGLT